MTQPFNPLATGLTGFDCGTAHDHTTSQTVCTNCGMPLRVDLDLAGDTAPTDVIDSTIQSMWRYGGVLPIGVMASVSLVEGWTPLIDIGDDRSVHSLHPSCLSRVSGSGVVQLGRIPYVIGLGRGHAVVTNAA